MITDQDRELISSVSEMLGKHMSLREIAKALGFDSSNALYQRIYRLGYRVETERKLVCLHGQA